MFEEIRQITRSGWKYGNDDSLVMAGALFGNCNMLYSENLQTEQHSEPLTILNPFLDL